MERLSIKNGYIETIFKNVKSNGEIIISSNTLKALGITLGEKIDNIS